MDWILTGTAIARVYLDTEGLLPTAKVTILNNFKTLAEGSETFDEIFYHVTILLEIELLLLDTNALAARGFLLTHLPLYQYNMCQAFYYD